MQLMTDAHSIEKTIASVREKIGFCRMEAPAQQTKVLAGLLKMGANTQFAREHKLHEVNTSSDFSDAVPFRTYESFLPWIERVKNGERDVLWNGLPLFFARTSGTTGGFKYLPVTKESLHYWIASTSMAKHNFLADETSGRALSGTQLYIAGAPPSDMAGTIPAGRMTGIVHTMLPVSMLEHTIPSKEVNGIKDWDEKMDRIIETSITSNVTIISSFASWMLMYFKRMREKTGRSPASIFPDLSLLIHSGVSIHPYRAALDAAIGRKVQTMELLAASEGVFAFQDTYDEAEGLLLNTNAWIYFEFIPFSQGQLNIARRIPLSEVVLGVVYVLVVSSNAGLWGYDTGDLVTFTSIQPWRIKVVGRTSQYLSVAGEHLIASDVEASLAEAAHSAGIRVSEFTVAPLFQLDSGYIGHEWLIEFDHPPTDLDAFSKSIEQGLMRRNVNYKELISKKVLGPPVLRVIPNGKYHEYMRSVGRLGEQFKLPHLSNDRQIADAIHILLKQS